jgi:hypothetical protein
MAHSPAVLTAYTSLRAVLAEHSTFDPKVGAALTLATAGATWSLPPDRRIEIGGVGYIPSIEEAARALAVQVVLIEVRSSDQV